MCEYCQTYPHRAGCPNYAPKVVYTCDNCEEPIYEGDTYYHLANDLCLCEDCVDTAKTTAEEKE